MKVNNNQLMCHLSMKLSNTFDPNPLVLFTKLGKTHSDEKSSHSLTLRAKVQVVAKIKRQCPRKQRPCCPPKNEQGFAQLLVSN